MNQLDKLLTIKKHKILLELGLGLDLGLGSELGWYVRLKSGYNEIYVRKA